jgi:hypothetical protein
MFSQYRDSFWAIKWPGHEVHRSFSSGAEVRTIGAVRLHTVCIHGVGRENFTFTMLSIFLVILGLSDVI